MTTKIRNVIVGKTISVYFVDGKKVATMKAHRLMEHLVAAGQWTFNVERTMDEGATEHVKALAEELKADISVVGDTTFKFKVRKDFIQTSTAPVEAKTYIRLGRDAIFDNVQAAFDHVRNVAKEAVPANMMVGLTKTFDRGTVEGQIKSVFSDVITYGVEAPAVAKKVTDFLAITDKDDRYAALRVAIEEGAAAAEGFSVNSTFKYLYLVTTAKELLAAAPEVQDEAKTEEAATKAA